jgi:hypothetical protein
LDLRGPEVTGECRKLSNEQFHDLVLAQYYSGDQIKKNEMGKHVARMWRREMYTWFGGENWRAEPLGRPRCGWKNNIKIDLQKSDGAAWTRLIWLRLATGD